VLFTVHDEVVVEVDSKTNINDVANILKAPIPWLPNCPMDVEIESSQFYKK